MKRELKIGALSLLLIALIGISIYLYSIGYLNFVIITATFSVINLIILINVIISTRSEESLYNSKVKQILRTYDAILVKSNNHPKIDEKNIIIVETFEDLVDAQMELRKPIYYQQQTESCSFVLLDNTEACVFILKKNPSVVCPLEITLNEIEIRNNSESKKEDLPDELLQNIEKTTIVRVGKGQYLKVSPLRKKKEKKEDLSNETIESTINKEEEIQQPAIKEENTSPTIPTVQENIEIKNQQPIVEVPVEKTNDIPVVHEEKVTDNTLYNAEPQIIKSMPTDMHLNEQKQESIKEIEVLDL